MILDVLYREAFYAAREGKTIGGMGGIKEYTYETYEDWVKAVMIHEDNKPEPPRRPPIRNISANNPKP